MTNNDVKLIRELAFRVKEISTLPRYARNRQKWAEHNDLTGDKSPLLWICPDDDGGWLELIPESSLQTQDPELRHLERQLRKMIYHHENFSDDYVIEPIVRFDISGEYTGYHYGDARQTSAWGVPVRAKPISGQAYHLDNFLDSEEKINLFLNHEVDFIIDQKAHDHLRNKYLDALDGIIELQMTIPYVVLVQSLIIELVHLRGLSELMVDLYDNADLIHQLLDHMSASKVRLLEKMENAELLYDNRSNFYTGSGGLGYSNTSKTTLWSGKLDTMWGFADAQEFSGVSPDMFREFAVKYQKKGLDKFGLSCYGCCESMDEKMDIIFQELANLRRVSVSPWSNIEKAAATIGDRAIYSWKPNPVDVCIEYNQDIIETNLKRLKKSTQDKCFTEIILKDIRTCSGHPENLGRFIDQVKQIMI